MLENNCNMSNSIKFNVNSPDSMGKSYRHHEDDNISYSNRCGIFKWRPDFLQRFRSVYLFLFTMCIVCIVQTALSAGYMSSQITTLERRFSLDSKMLGIIQSFFDVGFIASVVFVGFFGGQGRIPLWIGCGMLIMSVGAFSFAIPEFISVFKTSNGDGLSNVHLCVTGNYTNAAEKCVPGNKANWLVKMLFIFGQILIGCGSSPVLSLGPTYIDDHVIPTMAPPLIAMLYASSALGPVFGFGLGATMLKFPVTQKIASGSRPGDPDWVGAWWGGYVCLGLCCALSAIFLFMFPKKVRKIKEMKKKSLGGFGSKKPKNNEVVADDAIRPNPKDDYKAAESDTLMNANNKGELTTTPELQSCDVSRQLSNPNVAQEYGKNLRDIPGAVLSLLQNKVYIVVSLAICFEMFLVNGFAAFLPKYIETEYKVSNITASLIAGGLIVPSGAMGIIVGGVIMHRFQMSRRRAILFSIGAVILVLVCLILFFITGCQNPLFAGINTPLRYDNKDILKIQTNCSATHCINGCNINLFSPVCDTNSGVTYFSPCFAGCKNYLPLLPSNQQARIRPKTYYNCSCSANSLNYKNPPRILEAGECSLKCNSLITFVLFLTMALFLTGITQNPLLMVTMRSVQKHERAFSLGFQFVILRLLAYIPSPIVYGSVIDYACVIWKSICNERGDCLVTDLKLLNQYLIGLSFAVKIGAAVFYIILFFILPKHSHIMNPESTSGIDDIFRENIIIDSKSNSKSNLSNNDDSAHHHQVS